MKNEAPKLIPGTLPSPDELFHTPSSNSIQTGTAFTPCLEKRNVQIPTYRLEGRIRYLFLLIPLAVIILFLSHDYLGFGFYCMTSSSMDSAIPTGSLLFDSQVQPKKLKLHDIITFETRDGQCVTHEIVGIFPDYNGTGNTAFRTKGTDNSFADKNIVLEKQILGKVMFHIPKIGAVLYGMRE